jgi:hypothetical protein
MALSADGLKSLIISNLQLAGFATGNQYSKIPDFAEAVAKAIVTEIQSNAVVMVNVTTTGGSGTGIGTVS